jgi:hypothetical protein
MTLTGFIILVVLVLIGIWIFVELAKLPGQKALDRNHPQADAINVLGWVGLLFGGIPWLIALVWAYTDPFASPSSAAAPAVVEEGVDGD